MPPPDQNPTPAGARVEFLLALGLGVVGLTCSIISDDRIGFSVAAVIAWTAALLVFGAAHRGRRFRLPIAAVRSSYNKRRLHALAAGAGTRSRRHRLRAMRSSWFACLRQAYVCSVAAGSPVRALLGRLVRQWVTAAFVAAALVTFMATVTWTAVPLAVIAWAWAGHLLGVPWTSLLGGSAASLAGAALMTMFGQGELSDLLAVVAYTLAWVACGTWTVSWLQGSWGPKFLK